MTLFIFSDTSSIRRRLLSAHGQQKSYYKTVQTCSAAVVVCSGTVWVVQRYSVLFHLVFAAAGLQEEPKRSQGIQGAVLHASVVKVHEMTGNGSCLLLQSRGSFTARLYPSH